jgi:predicted O-methyltransferase YrrM
MKEILEQVKVILPSIHGWCSYEKAAKFIEIITEQKPQLCVEIGVFGGSSLIPQALALKPHSGVIIGIDPWKNDAALESMIDEANKKWWGDLNLEQIYSHCKENITKYKVQSNCKLIRDKSENVVSTFQDNSIDLLHIDGNHSEDLSYKDATLYLPKVKSGGFIFFDDIYWTEGDNYATTRKAITYLLAECEKVDIVNNDCLILRKK